MRAWMFETLEARRLLAADLAVDFKSTTLGNEVVVGVLPTLAKASVTVANIGTALAKTDSNVTLKVFLASSGGTTYDLGSTVLKASAIKAVGKPTNVNLVIPTTLPAGTYTLKVSASGPADSNSANDVKILKTITATGANADVVVTGTTTLAGGSVASGTTGKATVIIRNNGNVAAKATGKIEILQTIGGTTTVIATMDKVAINLDKNKFYTSKPIAFTVTSASSTSVAATISARYTPSVALAGDLLPNNTSTVASVSIGAPPASPLDGTGLPEVITFKSKKYFNIGGSGYEQGEYTVSGDRKGTFYMTVGTGVSNGYTAFTPTAGAILPSLVLHPNSGQPKWSSRKITFGVPQAGAAGYVEVAGKTVYYK